MASEDFPKTLVEFDERFGFPNVHRDVALLKRWLFGTHQGRVEEKHLQACLDEFAFRFNRRKSDTWARSFPGWSPVRRITS